MHPTRKRALVAGTIAVFLFESLLRGDSQARDIPVQDTYQKRGDRSEGILPSPVSGNFVELLSAVIEDNAKVDTMPANLRVRFYLPEEADVFLTVREKLPRYYYWVDKIQPPHRSKGQNAFQWPRSDVLTHYPDIHMQDLGVVVRIGQERPSPRETIAPVAFGETNDIKQADGYVFTFTTVQDAAVECTVFDGSDTVGTQNFPLTSRRRPNSFHWKASNMKDGTYRLVIRGKFKRNGTEFAKTVIFYHKHALDSL